MAMHTDHISRSEYLEIRRISSVRDLLTRKATAQLMWFFVLSRLDYCNSLLIASPLINCTVSKKFQYKQRNSFFPKSRHEYVKPLLKKFHWLPVKERILFKIATFAFPFFDGTLPPYIIPTLCVHSISYCPFQFWRKKNLFPVKGFGHRSFSVQTPLVWNNLSPYIRHSSSLSQFKTSPKTFFFPFAFSELPWSPGRLLFLFCFHGLCYWSVNERDREGNRAMEAEMKWGRERGEGERERERERERGGRVREGEWRGRGRERLGERELCNI